MNARWRSVARGLVAVVGLALLSGGCASTRVTDSWKSESLPPEYEAKNVLVVALVPGEDNRRQLEQELSGKLQTEGVSAAPSEQWFPRDREVTREELEEVVRDNGFDAVLVTTFKGFEEETHYESSGMAYGGYYGWYGYGAGVPVTTESAMIETSLYDPSADGERVWSATTSTFEPDNAAKEIPGVAEVIVSKLDEDGLL